MKNFRGLSTWLAVILAVAGLTLAGCAGGYTPKNAPDVFACVPEDKLERDITAEAELQELSCSFKKWEGSANLHFKVTVKNLSDKPRRFRVNIFLDNDKAVGGLIPRLTKKGLVNPGESMSETYPVPKMAKQPKEILLKIGLASE